MLKTIIFNELKAIIRSPKFTATFAVCSILLLLSVYTGIEEYQASTKNYELGTQIAKQQAEEASSWRSLKNTLMRKPDPMQIFVSGLTYDIGRLSRIERTNSVKLRHSAYSDDPIFAVFRFIDFTFIFQIVLSLFAILFTFDAINGERERGTLKLIFSNSVSRANFIIGKSVGAWLGLVVPLLIPILLGILMVLFAKIPFTGDDWLRLISLIGLSFLFFTFFIILGIFISTITKHSSLSFLVSLVIWLLFVLIIPKAGVMASSQIVSVPREAELEGQRDGFAKGLWAEHYNDMSERFTSTHRTTESETTEDHDEEMDEEAMWNNMMREDSLRRLTEQKISEFEAKLFDDLRLRKRNQQRVAFSLARISPVSAYQLAAMTIAETDISLKQRTREDMDNYRTKFLEFTDRKKAESGDQGGFLSISFDSEKGMSIGTGRDNASLDLSEMPQYQASAIPFSESFGSILIDMLILSLGIIVTFLGAFITFLRYDVR